MVPSAALFMLLLFFYSIVCLFSAALVSLDSLFLDSWSLLESLIWGSTTFQGLLGPCFRLLGGGGFDEAIVALEFQL